MEDSFVTIVNSASNYLFFYPQLYATHYTTPSINLSIYSMNLYFVEFILEILKTIVIIQA